jgi:hypothetical protein
LRKDRDIRTGSPTVYVGLSVVIVVISSASEHVIEAMGVGVTVGETTFGTLRGEGVDVGLNALPAGLAGFACWLADGVDVGTTPAVTVAVGLRSGDGAATLTCLGP